VNRDGRHQWCRRTTIDNIVRRIRTNSRLHVTLKEEWNGRCATLRPPYDDGPGRDASAGVIPRCKHSTSHTHKRCIYVIYIFFCPISDTTTTVSFLLVCQNTLSPIVSLNFSLTIIIIIIIIAGHFRGPFIVMVTRRRRICFVCCHWPSALTREARWY
jgi:hypothetical protein